MLLKEQVSQIFSTFTLYSNSKIQWKLVFSIKGNLSEKVALTELMSLLFRD